MRRIWLWFVCLSLAPAASAQWHQYLGPTGDSVSTETGLLDEWPTAGPKELWRIEMGAEKGSGVNATNLSRKPAP